MTTMQINGRQIFLPEFDHMQITGRQILYNIATNL